MTARSILMIIAMIASPALAEPISADRIRVVDGDTIRADDKPVRLVGFNTPETFRAKDDAERAAGKAATQRLRDIIDRAKRLDLAIELCACRAGTHGTTRCNFGRSCGRLTADGRDVGEILIGEGLAQPYVCGASGCPRRSR